MSTVCRKCLVSGRVQGVFYRATAAQFARQFGITGYAKNLLDGRVELLACGEEDSLRRFIEALWTGSSGSKVIAVDVSDCEVPSGGAPKGFTTG